MKIKLVLAYRPPNTRNKRLHWKQTMREKHTAQDALLSALSSAASSYSTQMPSTDASRICSTAFNTLGSFVATGRTKSISSSISSVLPTTRKSGQK